jgi:signal transduction histidine kinase
MNTATQFPWTEPAPAEAPEMGLQESTHEDAHAVLIPVPNGNGPAADENLLQSQRWEAMGRLTGGVVHDFNNLLTGIMLYCDLLLSSLESGDRCRGYADEIRNAVIQSTGLVQQLLVFARPQSSQVRPLCWNQITQAMQSLLTRLIGEHIILDFALDPNLGLVMIDLAQAQQVLLNLVLNARDALPNGGRIAIETRNCEFQTVPRSGPPSVGMSAFPCVLFTVSDNGCGMSAKTRERLFEPFFTTKSAGKGTGLGLTTVRTIVSASGGLIHVESEIGQGTRAMVLLPSTPPSAAIARFPGIAAAQSESPEKPCRENKKESLL